jgi:tetratricopeptide (TPR) repeat protein
VRSFQRTSFWENEETLFRSAVAASPKSLYTQWGLGRVLLTEFRKSLDPVVLNEARDAFARAQDLGSPPDGSPADPSILVTLHDLLQANLGIGWFYLLCSEYSPEQCAFEEAELIFRETVKKFPDSERAKVGLGVSLMYLNRLDEAHEELTGAVTLNPRLPEGWFNLGQVELRQERWDEAATHFQRALDLSPDEIETMAGLAEALVQGDRGADARRVLSRALERDPEHPRVLVQLGALAGRESRPKKALEWLDRALQIDGRLGNAHLLRAKALLQTGDMQRAVGAFQEACRWMPGSFDAHYNLGVLLLTNGLTEQGTDYLRTALRIEPGHPLGDQIRAEIARIEAAGGADSD